MTLDSDEAIYETGELLQLPLEELLQRAAAIRDKTYGTRITYLSLIHI